MSLLMTALESPGMRLTPSPIDLKQPVLDLIQFSKSFLLGHCSESE